MIISKRSSRLPSCWASRAQCLCGVLSFALFGVVVLFPATHRPESAPPSSWTEMSQLLTSVTNNTTTTTTTIATSSSLADSTSSSKMTSSAVESGETPAIEAFRLQPDLAKVSAEEIWEALLRLGSKLLKDDTNKDNQQLGLVMEVGVFQAKQCKQAAEAGFQAHCFEPSPTNYQRVMNALPNFPRDVVKRMHVYNQAASSSSEGTLTFSASGSTGDHVGGDGYDMWLMEKQAADQPKDPRTQVVEVQQVKLDDFIDQEQQSVFLIKVDTQGFEPTVFSGLQKSIQTHKLKYALFEYWPKGMDFLADQLGKCLAVDSVLKPFLQAGYKVYALSVAAHPRAPKGWYDMVPSRPFDHVSANCRWYYKVEEAYPSTEYKMGYWSDMLAVAPDAPIPVSAIPPVAEKIRLEEKQQRRQGKKKNK